MLGVNQAGITPLAAIPLRAVQSESLSQLHRLLELSITDLAEDWPLLVSSDKRRDNPSLLIPVSPHLVALEPSAGPPATELSAPVLPDMKEILTRVVFRIPAIPHHVEKMEFVRETVKDFFQQ